MANYSSRITYTYTLPFLATAQQYAANSILFAAQPLAHTHKERESSYRRGRLAEDPLLFDGRELWLPAAEQPLLKGDPAAVHWPVQRVPQAADGYRRSLDDLYHDFLKAGSRLAACSTVSLYVCKVRCGQSLRSVGPSAHSFNHFPSCGDSSTVRCLPLPIIPLLVRESKRTQTPLA